MKSSWFIGVMNLKYSTRTKHNYLEGKNDNLPILGFEDQKVKNTFNVVLDYKKTKFMHNDIEKEVVQSEAESQLTDHQSGKIKWLPMGRMKLKISVRKGIRFLEGYISGNPVKGWENREIKNRFHIAIDEKRLAYLRDKNPNGADQAEVVA